MVVKLRQHIELRGDSPLAAVIAGTPHNAHLVATFAIGYGGVDAAMEQYEISRADVHAALTFYYDHQATIEQALAEKEASMLASGMASNLSDKIAELKQRQSD